MFASTRKAAKIKVSSKDSSIDGTSILPSKCLPEHFSVAQLYQNLELGKERTSKEDDLQNLLILNSCLNNSDRRLSREKGDEEYIELLSLSISKAILPDKTLNGQDEIPEASREKALILIHQKSSLGLQTLQSLINLSSPSTLDPQILITLIAYSSSSDPWTTPSTTAISQSILALYKSQTHTQSFITTSLLTTFIRPLFSTSKPNTITSSGRAAISSSAPPAPYDIVAERASKPWKYETVYAIRVFAWAVENAPGEIIQQNWPFIPPPLLTLLDDPTTPIRTLGTSLLPTFLPLLTPLLLHQTGLGPVFEDALLPTLLYLPSLTPLSESLLLLPATYKALYTLADARYDDDHHAERIEFLDRVMRQGVLVGYHHASEHPEIVTLLLEQMRLLVGRMGVHAVKHLKAIIPVITTPLLTPFSSSDPQLLLSALRALQAVLLNCWVRIGEERYRMEILSAVVVCWRDVGDADAGDEGLELEEVRRELGVTGRLFVRAVEGAVDIRAEMQVLVDVDEGVGVLFGISD